MGDTRRQADWMAVITPHPAFLWPLARVLDAEGRKHQTHTIFSVPASFRAVPKMFSADVHPDVVLLQVAPLERAGDFSLGTTGAYSRAAARACARLLVEVNARMPRTCGDALLPVSAGHAIVEQTSALPERLAPPAQALDRQLGRAILALVPEHACVQFGIGNVPNALAAMLQDHRELGVHTALLSDGSMRLLESGAVTNKDQQSNRDKPVFNVATGSQALYDALHENPSLERDAAECVNDPSISGLNEHVLAVNAMIEVDVSGPVKAEFLHHPPYSAPGGQLAFVRGAALSTGGISLTAGHATADHGRASRIVPRLEGPITDPRMNAHFIVTEYGGAICAASRWRSAPWA
jgi:itaconate CoA-transferase